MTPPRPWPPATAWPWGGRRRWSPMATLGRARSRPSPSTRSCPTARSPRWSPRAATSSGCACPGPTPQRVRRHARPGRRRLPARPGRRHRAGRPPLPAGHHGAGDDLADPDGLAHRPRRAAASAPGTTRRARSATHRRRPTDYEAEHVLLRTVTLRQRRGGDAAWTASRCSTTAAAGATWAYTGEGYDQASPRRRTGDLRAAAGHRPAPRVRGPRRARPHPLQRGRRRASSRCPGPITSRPTTWRGGRTTRHVADGATTGGTG